MPRPGRLQVIASGTCNNRCLFCNESESRRRAIAEALGGDGVRTLLAENAPCGEVMFTSGEPTLSPHLVRWIAWARALGYRRIGITTNGRRLAYEPYARALLAAGLNHVVVSVHGHEAKLHDGLVRTPGAFAQTAAGLRTVGRLKAEFPGLELHTSTVLTRRNLPHAGDVYDAFADAGVDQFVYNVVQPLGRAAERFEAVVPRYREVAATFAAFVARLPRPLPAVYLVDIPLCTTEALPDAVRGGVERVYFVEPDPAGGALRVADSREFKDEARHAHGEPCRGCAYRHVCPGVWRAYTERRGWEEFAAVAAARRPVGVGSGGGSSG